MITFWRIVISTIVAVRLSIIAESKKASNEKINSKPFLDLVFIKFLIVANPLK